MFAFSKSLLGSFYNGGVDPMLDHGYGFEFNSDGKKVVKATGGLITLVSRTAASLTNCDFRIVSRGRATRLA